MKAMELKPSDGRTQWRILNLLVNVSLTLTVLIINKTYQRRRLYFKDFAYKKIVPCAIYRSRMVLNRWPAPKVSAWAINQVQIGTPRATVAFDSQHHAIVRHLSSDIRQPIRLVRFKRSLFDSRRTIVPKYTPITPLPMWFCVVLYGVGVFGLANACISVTFLIQTNGDLHDTGVKVTSITSLIFTTLFCIPFVCSYQRHLVRMLLRNFDYWFSSLQFAVGSVLLSDLCQWTPWCVSIISWNLWFQWVLMMDALTPIVKKRLRFRKCYAVPVMVAILVNAIGTLYLTSAPGTMIFHDRALTIIQVGRFTLTFHSSSVLFYRIVTILTWTVRLLESLAFRPEDELLLIRGALEYYSPVDVFPPLRPRGVVPSTGPVGATVVLSKSPSGGVVVLNKDHSDHSTEDSTS